MEPAPGVQMLVEMPLLLFVSKRRIELVAFSFTDNVTKNPDKNMRRTGYSTISVE